MTDLSRHLLPRADLDASLVAMQAEGADFVQIVPVCHRDGGLDVAYFGAGQLAIICHECQAGVIVLGLKE